MALHKDFRRLMVDIEVYVDRIASMRIKDLNTALEVTRAQLQAKCDGDETALDLRTIESAIIDEDEYFSYTVHNDMTASSATFGRPTRPTPPPPTIPPALPWSKRPWTMPVPSRAANPNGRPSYSAPSWVSTTAS